MIAENNNVYGFEKYYIKSDEYDSGNTRKKGKK